MRSIRLFTIQPERLDYWRIREGKERGNFSLRAIGMLVAGPGRDGKDISLFPIKTLALNDTPPCPLQDHVDATACLAMCLRVRAGAQMLCCATHGRQDRATGVGIGVLQEQIIVGVAADSAGPPAPRRCGSICNSARVKSVGRSGHWLGAAGLMIQARRDIVWLRDAVLFTGGVLSKDDIQGFEEWQIQTIQPDHRLGRLIAVIVPGPRGGQDQVPRLHKTAFTIHGSIRTTAFHHHAQG